MGFSYDLVGIVDQIGEGACPVSNWARRLRPCRSAAATHNMFAWQRKFIPVPAGLDPAEAVAGHLELHHGIPDAESFGEAAN